MRKTVSTGIYFSQSTNNHSQLLDYREIYAWLETIPNVKAVENSMESPLMNPELFVDEIRSKDIGRLIIAGSHPGFLKPLFSRAMKDAGMDPDQVLLVDFYLDHPEGIPLEEWAKTRLRLAVSGISLNEVTSKNLNPVQKETLVIGGGIAGIQASLEIADSHNKVYLVEKTGTIGGHMAMFDKTFPTLDCAACILTPKMVDVAQHPYIDLMTYCEVKRISGVPGNYKVTILQKARRVNLKTCIGCGTCAEKCPSKVKSEFDAGTTLRKAIYMPFPQAVPNKYLIDKDFCRYVENGKCGVCEKVCPVENCINLDEEDSVIEIDVGNIVVATGFQTFDASRIEQYGYGRFPNVITSLELERLVNASGPTSGNITLRSVDKKGNQIFTSDSPVPKSIAIIHCIGSRDENYRKYCSRVCCMYSLKLAHLIKEKIPDAKIYEHYIDMRAFGKGYEEFYKRIENEGVNLIRGKIAKIEESGSQLIVRAEDIEKGKLIENKVDMVVLAVGLEPRDDTDILARKLGISLSEDGWLKEADDLSNSTSTSSGGVHLAGACQGPKDIPDSVVQASAAAAAVLRSISINGVSKNLKNIPMEDLQGKLEELTLNHER